MSNKNTIDPIQNSSGDTITRFAFEDCDVRGEMITLTSSLNQAIQHQHLPPAGQKLLAEFLSAVSLLAGILKFEGLLTLQIRGDGAVPLIMAEATHERSLRGIVKIHEGADLTGLSLNEMIGHGVLSLTIDPVKGQRYQGIVPIEGNSIAECLSHYFTQSEQLPTKLWLFSDIDTQANAIAGGFFLQGLPAHYNKDPEQTADTWLTLHTLANTLKVEESLRLAHKVQLTRLFHEYAVIINDEVATQFACSCSQARSENALSAIGSEDAYALLAEQGTITIDCQFCGQKYRLDYADLDRLFGVDGTQH